MTELTILRCYDFHYIRSDNNGQDQEYVHQMGTPGGRVWIETREARQMWFGHARRKYAGYIGRRMLRMELPGERTRGRPKRQFMDAVRADMAGVEVTEEDADDRTKWR